MSPSMKLETTPQNVYRRLFPLVMMFSALTLPVNTSLAQGVIPPPSSIAMPMEPVAPTAACAQLDPQTSSVGDFLGSSSSSEDDLPSHSLKSPIEADVAPIHAKYIPDGFIAQPIGARDKALIGLRESYTPFDFAGFFIEAGYSHVKNDQPNYGTDSGAFGARLGAAAIGETTQEMFTDVLFAPLLREDPRYYVEGPQYGFIHRVVYAATRSLITRTDSGRSTVNGANLLGYAAAAALSRSYYPDSNRNLRDTFESFGGSIGGESFEFLIREFSIELLEKMHLAAR